MTKVKEDQVARSYYTEVLEEGSEVFFLGKAVVQIREENTSPSLGKFASCTGCKVI